MYFSLEACIVYDLESSSVSDDDTLMLIYDDTYIYIQTIAKLNHLCQMEFPIVINWTSTFPTLGLFGGIFYLYSNLKRSFCKQTVENLSRRRVLRRLIWFCTVCRYPQKRTLGLYRLMIIIDI